MSCTFITNRFKINGFTNSFLLLILLRSTHMNQTDTNTQDIDSIVFAFQIMERQTRQVADKVINVSDASQRITTQTNFIIRISILIAMLLTPFLFYMIYTLTFDMSKISLMMVQMDTNMQGMRENFEVVTDNVTAMEQHVSHMSQAVASLPHMDHTVVGMRDTLHQMTDKMQQMQGRMGNMDGSMQSITQNVSSMNNVFSHMNQAVLFMQHNVETLSRPARMMPFNW